MCYQAVSQWAGCRYSCEVQYRSVVYLTATLPGLAPVPYRKGERLLERLTRTAKTLMLCLCVELFKIKISYDLGLSYVIGCVQATRPVRLSPANSCDERRNSPTFAHIEGRGI